MIDIIKKVRHMQVMLNSTQINTEIRKYKLGHTFHNVIDLEQEEFAYPKKNKVEDLAENPYQANDQIDENLDHQILNRGVPLYPSEAPIEFLEVHEHKAQPKPQKFKELRPEKETPVTQTSRKGNSLANPKMSRSTRHDDYSEQDYT
jgi:hypothetical protein